MPNVPFSRVPFSNASQNQGAPGGRTVLLTEAVIQRLASDSQVIAKYPFLRPPSAGKPVSKGCKCGRSKTQKAQDSGWANNAKISLLNLSNTDLAFIKSRIGASLIVAYIKGPRGVEKREF